MTKHVIKTNVNDGLVVSHDNDRWIINKGVTIDNGDLVTILNEKYNKVNYEINGIVKDGGSAYAISDGGDANSLSVSETGKIKGVIYSSGDLFSLFNEGVISSAVSLAGADYSLKNHGKISAAGSAGIYLNEAESGTIVNQKGGVIQGDLAGIQASNVVPEADNVVVIKNAGTIMANAELSNDFSFAIELSYKSTGDNELVNTGSIKGHVGMSGGDDMLVNKGQITGGVYLGLGNDTANLRGGSVGMTVHGGIGNDVYIVDQQNVPIAEKANEGKDEVKSTVSFTLGDNIERLQALGAADIKLIGNGLDNTLVGNGGGNKLSGLAGADDLMGGQGNDILIGGDGSDTFIFNQGQGIDHIKDFHPDGSAIDLIQFSFISGIEDYDDVVSRMTYNNGNTIINLGDGNKVIVEGMNQSDWAEDHFKIVTDIPLP